MSGEDKKKLPQYKGKLNAANIAAENYADEETGLYGQSALHIVGLFIIEQDGNIDESRLQ